MCRLLRAVQKLCCQFSRHSLMFCCCPNTPQRVFEPIATMRRRQTKLIVISFLCSMNGCFYVLWEWPETATCVLCLMTGLQTSVLPHCRAYASNATRFGGNFWKTVWLWKLSDSNLYVLLCAFVVIFTKLVLASSMSVQIYMLFLILQPYKIPENPTIWKIIPNRQESCLDVPQKVLNFSRPKEAIFCVL